MIMKKYILTIMLCLSAALLYIACDDMNSINQEYLDRGETIYTGVVDSVLASPGNNRVWFNWFINYDPRITKTVIYWNEKKDSTVIPINRTSTDVKSFETTLNIAEGSYVFQFVTKDDEGHYSVNITTSEISVDVYGARYIAGLMNRSVSSITTSKIVWGDVETASLLFTTVSYTDKNGVSRSIRVENDEAETTLTDAQTGIRVSIVSTFLPVGGLDEVEALAKTYTL